MLSKSFLRSMYLCVAFVFVIVGCQDEKSSKSLSQSELPSNAISNSDKAFDTLIINGTIYDGTGSSGYSADIAIINDRIVKIGKIDPSSAISIIDAKGKVVAPGFINMLSWGPKSLMDDGRGLSDIVQGVTLEIFGEGWSMGPISPSTKIFLANSFDFKSEDEIQWQTLGEYMTFLADKGVSPNIASFVGATTLRMYEMGQEDRPPSDNEMESMRQLTHQAMQEGALGLGSSLIYAPAFFASTKELTELAKVVGEYDGMYISHMRSEGNAIESAVDELIQIARDADVAAEIYHLKFAGQDNWHKFDIIIDKVEQARAEGLQITADMYTYKAGGTGLAATMPPWASEGGVKALVDRLKDPEIRKKIMSQMVEKSDSWENLYLASGAKGIKLMALTKDHLKQFNGKSIAEIASIRKQTDIETIVDLIVEEENRIDAIFFLMSDENIKRKVKIPWLSFASDAAAVAPEGKVIEHPVHPRAYGNFSRVLGQYVRRDKLISMAEAIRKLSGLPATNLKLKDRGFLKTGYFADIVIFDPDTIIDKATFDNPHQLAIGMEHVFVNGEQVLKNGRHTGKFPGRFVRGPGYKKANNVQMDKAK